MEINLNDPISENTNNKAQMHEDLPSDGDIHTSVLGDGVVAVLSFPTSGP